MSTTETLPDPEEVLDDSRIQYQAMTELSDEEYRRLADDIRERGVLQPIVTDENGTILDGHHRAALAEHFDLDESREPAYVVIGDLDEDADKLARAIKQNVLGRDTKDAVKSHAVEQYIETSWDRTDDGDLIRPETDSEVAEKLGVDRSLVSRVVNNVNAHIIDHDRVKARKYYEDNPDASYREVARQVDSAKATVTEWLKEDFDEGDDDGDDDDSDDGASLAAFARNKSEGEKAQETVQKANDDDADGRVQELAQQKVEEISQNKTSPDSAARKVSVRERVIDGERDPINPTDETDDDGDTEDSSGTLNVLNLYAGIGGNRKLWDDVDVTAVEWDEEIAEIYSDHFPDDEVIVADAHDYLREHIFDGWDYIWTSPPCPTHSRTNHFTQVQHESAQYPDMNLYEEILLLDHLEDNLGYDYTVENVVSYYEPLIEPQELGDHYFWTTVDLPEIEFESRNILSDADGRDSHFDFEREQRRLGYELDGYDVAKSRKGKMLRNCVKPELGRSILNQVVNQNGGSDD
ncbi:hypothetical protein OSG_eHP11_00135 [environmental Halophage eHP-11]|nr:hypothetical protein OSG_eHP11_00135 [environmental Halophage eHP-11]